MATTPEGLNARIGILGMARRYAKRKSEMAPIMDQREMMKAMAARYQVNKFQPPAAVAEGTNAAIPDPVSEVDLIKQRGSDVHAPGTSGGRIFQAVDYMTPNVVKKAYNTSLTGMAHELISGNKLFDLSAYDPSVIEDIASEVISFSMPLDAALMTVGGKAGAYVATKVGAPLIRKLVASGVKAEVAERIVGGAVGSVSSGTALGGYGATGAALQGGDAGEIVYAGLHSGALGLILGGTGAIAKPLEKFGMAGKAGQIGAEIGAFTVGGAGLEGRLPTTDDLSHAVGVVLGLKGMHKATGFVKSRLGEWILGKQMETKADLDIIMEELSKDPQEWEAFYKSLPGEAQKDLDQIRSDTYVPGGTVKLDAGEPLPETKPEVVNEKTEAIETKKTETQEVELDRPRDQPKVEAPKEQPAPLNTPLKDISFYQKHYPVGAKVNAANGIKGDIVGHDAETKLLQVKTESGDIVAVHPGDVKSLTRESAPPVSTTSTTNTTRPASNNDKKATYFTDRAAKLRQKAIDKTSGGVFDQNRTPRRERQRAHASEEAAQMNRIADVMEEFASRLQDGSLPKSLQGITTGTQLEALDYPWRQLYGQVDFEHQRRTRQQMMDWISMGSEDGKRLKKAGLNSKLEIMKAIDDYADLIKGETPEQAKKRELDKLESELVGTNAAGFFPTPKPVIDRMIEAADLQKSDKVLEPSAGKGDIVDAIKETGSENVDLAEINPMLRQILQLKGHGDNIDSDFTEMKSPGTYDKIVMNPPFEKGADVDHVRHAYNLLKPGGRIVSIMSEGSFFRSDKKATEFREWLDEVGTSEKLEPGSFKSAFRPTGVATRMVVIDKPGEITKETPPTTTGVPKTTDKTPVVSEGDKKPSHLQTSKEYKSERIPEELGRLERQIEDFRKQINIEEKELGENADNKNYFKNVAKAIIDSYEKEIEKLGDQKDYVQSDDYIDRSHPEEIAKALREGKEVPDNIKAQYPETKYQKPRNIQDVEVSLPSKGMKGVKDGLTAEVDKAIKSLEASEQVGIGIDMNASRIEPLRRELGLLESSLTDPTKNDVSKADSKKRIKELKEQISQFEESISRLPDQVRYKADGSTFVINNTLTDLRAFKDAIKATSATVYSSPAGKAPGKPPIRSGKSAKQNYYIEMPDTFVAPNEAGKSGTAYSVPIPLDPRPSGSLEQYKQQGTSGYATNGHYLIDGKRVKGVLKYADESQGNPEASKVTEQFEGKRGENSTPIEEIGRIKGGIAEDSKAIISLFYDPVGKKKYSFNAQYVDFMVKNVKDFRLEATTETGGAKIFSGNDYVGILMPLRTPSSVASARVIPFSTSGKPESIMRTEGMSFTENLRKVYEGDITGKGVGPADIRHHLSTAFGVPIRGGRTRGAAGLYYPHLEMIRSKDLKDISAMTHETAHHIDKRFNLRRDLFKGHPELKDLDYNQNEKGGRRDYEGFAEYMRHWLTESMDVQKIAPEFTKQFDEWLRDHPDTKKKLVETYTMIRQWRAGQGAKERIYQQIDIKGKGLPTPIIEKIKRGFRQVGHYAVDDLLMLEYAERQMRGMAAGAKLDPKVIDPATSPTMIARDVAKTGSAKARQMVLEGTFDFEGKRTGISLRAVLEPVVDNLSEFLTYTYAKRGVELHGRGINPGIDLGDAKWVVKDIESGSNSKVFKRASEELTAFNDRVLQYMVDAGAISPESAINMRQMNQYYLPLKRVLDKGQGGFSGSGGKRLGDLSSPVKRIKGSGLPIKHPLEEIIKQTEQMIAIADKVRVGGALVDLMESQASKKAEGIGKWIFPVKAPQLQVRIDPIKALEKMVEKDMLTPEDVPGLNTQGQMIDFYINQPKYLGKDNIISFWKDGKRKFYELDPDLWSAMKGMDQFVPPRFFDYAFGKPARMVRLGATGLNAGFALITNPIRDASTLALQTEFISTHRVFDKLMKGFWARTPYGTESMKNMRQLWLRSGADMSSLHGLDRKTRKRALDEVLANDKKRKALNIVSHPIDAMREILSFTEAGPRMAEFEAAYKSGEQLWGEGSAGARIMASNAAADVTINFRRMGVYGAWINQMVPFFNANVQGLAKFYRFAKEHPVKAMVKGLGITAGTMMLWDEHKDEKWYKNLPDWDKYGFWHFEIGVNNDGTPKIVRLPRPFEWGIAFASTPEAILNYWHDKEPKAFKEAMKDIGGQAIPPWSPTSLKHIYESLANYDYFKDRPIDPHWEVQYTKSSPDLRFSPWTSETAKFIGKQFGQSPRRIEHLISGATGGLGRDLIRAGERGFRLAQGDQSVLKFDQAADYPIVGRLFSRIKSDDRRAQSIKGEAKRLKGEINLLHREAENLGRPELHIRADELEQERDRLLETMP